MLESVVQSLLVFHFGKTKYFSFFKMKVDIQFYSSFRCIIYIMIQHLYSS